VRKTKYKKIEYLIQGDKHLINIKARILVSFGLSPQSYPVCFISFLMMMKSHENVHMSLKHNMNKKNVENDKYNDTKY
jgi:hypothetical protein